MATTNLTRERNSKKLSKDYESIKRDLIEHLRIFFPDTISDFNESSVGMMLVELMAFTSDNFHFYLDKQFNETFTESAIQPKNVLRHARQLGFDTTLMGKSAAQGQTDCFLSVPATGSNEKIQPDMRYAGKVLRGSKLLGNGIIYEILEDCDFSTVDFNDPLFSTVAETDSATKQPTSFALKKQEIDIKAGQTKTTSFTVGGYQPFLTLTISDEDVLEIIDVKDSEGNIWYKVDFLAQDTVFDSLVNTATDSTNVPYVLHLRSVPFRFITEYNTETKKTSMIFGTGDASKFDGELIPNLGDLSLPLLGKENFTDFTIDPQNFLKTRTLGVSPTNTTLTVRYRAGGGLNTNIGSGQISTTSEILFEVSDSSLSAAIVNNVKSSFSVLNSRPVQGGRDELTTDEVRHLIPSVFASQSRVVTAEDYIARTLSLPTRFGSIFRAGVKSGDINKSSVELTIVSRNNSGNVTTASTTLKDNLRRYLSRFRMLTDSIEILDGDVINLGIDFSILCRPDFNKTEVLGNCMLALKDFFDITKWQMGQPIIRAQILRLLYDVSGVITVFDLDIKNLVGTVDGSSYSTIMFNVSNNTKNDIIYCPTSAIFEIKYPLKNIRGSAR